MIDKFFHDFKEHTLLEILNKIVKKLNELITQFNNIDDIVQENFEENIEGEIFNNQILNTIKPVTNQVYDLTLSQNETDEKITQLFDRTDLANEKIDNIEIGGRNLLHNSNRYMTQILMGNYVNTILEIKTLEQLGLKVGDIITASCEVNTTNALGGMYLQIRQRDSANVSTIKNSQKIEPNTITKAIVTTTILPTTTSLELVFRRIDTSTTHYNFLRGFEKLEKGNKATDWTPSPEDVDNKIDNIKIGGRNYCQCLGGNNYNINMIHNSCRKYATIETIDNKQWVKFTGLGYMALTSIDVEPNTEYTWSFKAYSDTEQIDKSLRHHDGNTSYNRQSVNYLNVSQSYSYTFTTNSTTTKELLHLYLDETSITYFSDFKLEKGNKATDWTPSPEDIYNKLQTLNDEITFLKRKIYDLHGQ